MWLEVFCAVLAILCTIWYLGRYLLVEEIVSKPSGRHHNWKSIKLLSRACYCSYCEMMLVSSTGQFCDCCGVCADTPKCLRMVEKWHHCKQLAVVRNKVPPAAKMALPDGDNERISAHLWVRGNLPEHSVCIVCDEEVDYHAEPGLFGYRCCWCQRTTHTKCFARAIGRNEGSGGGSNGEQQADAAADVLQPASGNKCDFGEFRDMVLPPECIEITTFKGAQKVTITVPQGVNDWRPLFVVANCKSGDSNSADMISLFRSLLHPGQVAEIGAAGPRGALKVVAKLPAGTQARILVAGGDGTVGWILNTIADMRLEPQPQVCILPIGTGNDLSRVLRWGAEPPAGQLQAADMLRRIRAARPQTLDRWQVLVAREPRSRRIPLQWTAPALRAFTMYNYFSVGVDAKVALNFHRARQSRLYVFSSRCINKILYLCYGTQQVVQPDCMGLEQQVELYLDGERVELPEVQSIVCLNIDSWGAGVKLWEMSTPPDEPNNTHSTSDGRLEVLGIVSSFHIAQLQVGLNKPIRLGQAKTVKIVTKQRYPVQVDGEPWMQAPADITITHSGQASVLRATTTAERN